MPRTPLPRSRVHPARVWAVVTLVVFATECVVMLALPWVLPEGHSRVLEAALDAVVLTAVVSPVLWLTIVRPLREVLRIRTRFLGDLFAAIEAERRRIAYDLHDGVGQSLSLLVSGLRSAHDGITQPDVARRCRDLQTLAEAALRDVKRLALGLRPSLLDDLGLAPALERVVADTREHHAIDLALDVAGVADERLPERVETAVFRIVQEALSNVLRHSGATHASVRIWRGEGNVGVLVEDDGRGIEPAHLSAPRPGHLGLTGMRERATLLGGTLSVESGHGRGTRVTATIPVEDRPL